MKIKDYCPRCHIVYPAKEYEALNAVKWRTLLCKCPHCEHSLDPVVVNEDGYLNGFATLPQHLGKHAKRMMEVLGTRELMPRVLPDRKCDGRDITFIDCTWCPTGSWKDWEVPFSFDWAIQNNHNGFVLASGTNAAVAFVAANYFLKLFHPTKGTHIVIPQHVEDRFKATLDELHIPAKACTVHIAGTNGQQAAAAAVELAEQEGLPMLSGWAPWGRRYGLMMLFKSCMTAMFTEIPVHDVAYFQGVAGALGPWALTRYTEGSDLNWTPFLCMPSGSAPFAHRRPVNIPGRPGLVPFNPVVVGEESYDVGPNPVAPVLDSKATNAEQDRWHYRGNYPCVCLHNEEILESWRELRTVFPDVGLEAGTAYAGYKKTVKERPELIRSKQVVVNLTGRARPGDEELA